MSESVLTHLLAEKWRQRPDKPTARGTLMRYSSAGSCARQMGYNALSLKNAEAMGAAGFNVLKTNPEDAGDVWAPGIGTIIHEAMQAAIVEIFPLALFEVSSQVGSTSGSCDALLDSDDVFSIAGVSLGGTHVLWELKTMGEYAWDKQVGINRMRATRSTAAGPSLKAIAQAGMNALGIEGELADVHIETILMGSVCVTALSKAKAGQLKMQGFERFGAETRISRDVWEPLALAELARMEDIASRLDGPSPVILSDRVALDDNMEPVILNPRGEKDWQCAYCSYRDRCVGDGEGLVIL